MQTKDEPKIMETRWCTMLSTHGHRFCEKPGCSCPCHRNLLQANYEKNSVAKVKRLG